MDLEQDNDFLIYLVSFLGSLSVLPGNIISALLMYRVGRLKMIGELSGMSRLYCTGLGQRLKVEGKQWDFPFSFSRKLAQETTEVRWILLV